MTVTVETALPMVTDCCAEMAAPMVGANGQVVGVINLDSDTAGGFSEEDLQLFVTMTDEATSWGRSD